VGEVLVACWPAIWEFLFSDFKGFSSSTNLKMRSVIARTGASFIAAVLVIRQQAALEAYLFCSEADGSGLRPSNFKGEE